MYNTIANTQAPIVHKKFLSLRMKSLYLFLVTFILPVWGFAQSAYLPLNQDAYHLVERYEIKSGRIADKLPTHAKPYLRRAVARFADTVGKTLPNLSKTDKFNLAYLQNDSWEWSDSAQADSKRPIWKKLYRKKSDFYHVDTDEFNLHINPVAYGFVGKEQNNNETPYLNTRGLELRGMIARKVGFYTFVTDNQAIYPTYATAMVTRLNAVPNEGYYKRTIGGNYLDFFTARGYITLDAIKEKINVQFGYDRNVLGNGYRSLFLSDFSSNYLFLKLNTNVWKINYQNIFAQMTAEKLNGDGFYPQKFLAIHHLSVNLTSKLQVGVFEAIVFNRQDTIGTNASSGYFDLRYLNPIIFYRSIEHQAGSPDNANVGFDVKYYFAKRFMVYSQLLIDEFLLAEMRKGRGWRGNKHALQLGLKYIDVLGVKNLDVQLEFNVARPYTYSHNFKYSEYSNYNQPIAHPLGANFREGLAIVRYQPIPRLQIVGKVFRAKYGTDADSLNWGSNIFRNNVINIQEYGNKVGQGNTTNLTLLDLVVTYQFKHNIFVDLKQTYRREQPLLTPERKTFFTSIAFRWNIPARLFEF